MDDDEKAAPEDVALARLGEKLSPERDAFVDWVVSWMRALGVRTTVRRPPELVRRSTQFAASMIDIGVEYAHAKNTIPAAEQLQVEALADALEPSEASTGPPPRAPATWDHEVTPPRGIKAIERRKRKT